MSATFRSMRPNFEPNSLFASRASAGARPPCRADNACRRSAPGLRLELIHALLALDLLADRVVFPVELVPLGLLFRGQCALLRARLLIQRTDLLVQGGALLQQLFHLIPPSAYA